MRLSAFALTALPLVLSACGGGGGGGGGTLGGGGTPSASLGEVYRAEPTGSLLFDPFAVDQAMRDNPEFTASNTQGATGVMAMATQYGGAPVLRDVRLSLSEDRTTLTLQIQGVGTFNLDEDGGLVGPSDTGGDYGVFGTGQFVSLFHFGDTGDIDYSDGRNLINRVLGDGIYGLETPLDRLPSSASPVAYDGTFEMLGVPQSFSSPVGFATDGTFTMLLDFSDGSIGGTTSGTITYLNGSSLAQDSGATGTVTGTIAGNGVAGTFSLIGANSSASHTYEGNLYGWDAGDIGGGVIGTVTGPSGSSTGYGAFEGQLD